MKRLFRLSVAVNLFLGGWLLWMMNQAPKVEKITVFATPNVSSAVIREKFNWSQLECTNYQQYISNLKAIGCPRQTIRDIITADVHSLFAARHDEIATTQSNVAEAQELSAEEKSLLTELLGGSPIQPATTASARFQIQRNRIANNNVSVPVVFQSIDYSTLDLTERQVDDIRYLRSAFQQDLGPEPVDRSSPDYFKRWQSAQAQNDLMSRGILGSRLYEQLQGAAQDLSMPAQ